ncbi:NAD(P)-dependent oxidoreductase [Bordetella genomosp. 11]|uniref:Hydroxyacid dehydrogenase n=1 Tax=Bordetella genomosp. 11 TaxID=1416808 RepID=A0A261UFZ3_9BORD|nr:NAD(P)-dependent oxidoreductase [Bordetella genomosp. 11]OZI60824.1 hydroxyacid dehydrogenase [Bordetella genomosp. 11]
MPSQPIVVLTSAIHPDEHARLAGHATVRVSPDARPETLKAAVADADGLVVRNPLPADIFEQAPRLKGVVRHGVGLDMIPMEAANRRRIPVANIPGSNTASVVEYCLAAMLHLRRRLAAVDAMLRAQGWSPARSFGESGDELAGQTLGIVGVGAIGSRLAALAQALDMRVLGLTRRPQTLPAGVQAVDKPTLMRESDVIVLACPLNEQTRGLIDAQALALAKPQALLINVARGPVVDAAALLAAIGAGRLGGAALDVHDVQPLPADAQVFRHPGLLLTPHLAGSTAASMRRMSRGAVDEMLRILRGEAPLNWVNQHEINAD